MEVFRVKVRGDAIRQAYALLGLRRTEFADKVGISGKTLTNITTASGEPARTSLATAAKIAAALGWKVEDVLDKTADIEDGTRPTDNRPAPSPRQPPPPQRGQQPKPSPKNLVVAK